MGLEAQQMRAIGAQADDAGDGRLGIVDVAIVAALGEGTPDLLAQRPVGGEGQHRIDRRPGVDDRPALLPALSRRRLGDRLHAVGQAREACLVGDDDRGALVRQQPLRKLAEVDREILVEGGQFFLLRRGQLGPLPHETVIGARDQPLLLRVQAAGVARFVDRLDPREQPGVERDLVRRLGQLGRPFAVKRLIGGGVHVAGHHPEQRHHAVQRLPGILHRHEGVGEGRLGRVVGDPIIVLFALGQRGLERGREQLGLYLVPGGYATIGAGPWRKQRIGGGCLRQLGWRRHGGRAQKSRQSGGEGQMTQCELPVMKGASSP